MLSHPTRVREGISLVVTGSAHVMTDSSPSTHERRVQIRPSYTTQLAVGTRSRDDPEGPAARLAGGIGLTGWVADGYVELPRSLLGDLDAGLGVAAQWGYLRVAMPYVQIGSRLSGDWHWFTSQGSGLVHQRGWARPRAVWMPTIGATRETEDREFQIFVTGIVGGLPSMEIPLCFLWCFERTYVVKRTTFVFGLGMARLIRRLPPPARAAQGGH